MKEIIFLYFIFQLWGLIKQGWKCKGNVTFMINMLRNDCNRNQNLKNLNFLACVDFFYCINSNYTAVFYGVPSCPIEFRIPNFKTGKKFDITYF